jgi:hypothetical protein
MNFSSIKRNTPLRAKTAWRPVRTRMKQGGSVIPRAIRDDMGTDMEYTRCGLQGLLGELVGPCAGRVTREHAMYYGGSKVQERWAIIPCCAKHHGVDQFQDCPGQAPKEVREWVSLNRATDNELVAVSKAVNYLRRRDTLNEKYGVYVPPKIPR